MAGTALPGGASLSDWGCQSAGQIQGDVPFCFGPEIVSCGLEVIRQTVLPGRSFFPTAATCSHSVEWRSATPASALGPPGWFSQYPKMQLTCTAALPLSPQVPRRGELVWVPAEYQPIEGNILKQLILVLVEGNAMEVTIYSAWATVFPPSFDFHSGVYDLLMSLWANSLK